MIPFKYLLFSPHLKLCKLTCTRCTTAEFVQCIDSRAITCSSRFCSIYQFPEQLLRAVTGALQATAKRGGRDPNDPRNDLSRLPVNLKSTPLFTFRISPEMISAEYLSKFLVWKKKEIVLVFLSPGQLKNDLSRVSVKVLSFRFYNTSDNFSYIFFKTWTTPEITSANSQS